MKLTPQLSRVQEKMKPGVITGEGFLGDDTRNIADIIQRDEEVARTLDLDWEKTALLLRRLLDESARGLGEAVTVDGKWTVCLHEARGKLPCPFGDGLHRKHTASIVRTASGQRLVVSELSLHLLKEHHFLQGRGSPFRLEPDLLLSVLAD